MSKNQKNAEPLPEDHNEQPKNKLVYASYSEALLARKAVDQKIKELQVERKAIEKEMDVHFTKMEKEGKKKRNSKKEKDPTKIYQNRSLPMPEALYKFYKYALDNGKFSDVVSGIFNEIGFDKNTLISRQLFTKSIWDYAKVNNLKPEESVDSQGNPRFDKDGNPLPDGKVIVPDKALKTLFSMKDKETITFNTLPTYMSTLIPPAEKKEKPKPKAKKTDEKPAKAVSKKAKEPVSEENDDSTETEVPRKKTLKKVEEPEAKPLPKKATKKTAKN